MNMEILDTKKAYKAPRVKVVEVNVQGVLCESSYGTFTLTDDQVEKGSDDVWEQPVGW